MDSITQAALGASIAAVAAGKRCNGKVLLAGAMLGTLLDLDVLINYGDDVSNMVKHRGFSHSLFILPVFSWLLAFTIHKFKPIKDWSFTRLWLMISAILVTHPLLDFFTNYGTQLTWPIPGYFALSSIFIIDPLYTLPLLLAIIFGLMNSGHAAKYSAIALTVSTLYLGWSFIAQQMVEKRVDETLVALDIPRDNIFITAGPFNTLLWRVVVLDGDHYWEGLASVLDPEQEVHFVQKPLGQWPLTEKPKLLSDLKVFSKNLIRYHEENDQLIVSDLRMGMADNLAFQFIFATRDENGEWTQKKVPTRYEGISLEGDYGKLIDRIMGDTSIDAYLGDCSQCTSLANR